MLVAVTSHLQRCWTPCKTAPCVLLHICEHAHLDAHCNATIILCTHSTAQPCSPSCLFQALLHPPRHTIFASTPGHLPQDLPEPLGSRPSGQAMQAAMPPLPASAL
jgi:hypothetical protein